MPAGQEEFLTEFMDRALKERIVGAVVLVVLAVLVVPVFLDGSAEDAAVVSESVTLPGQNEQPRKQQTIVLNRNRSQPVPGAAGDAGTADGESPDTRTPSRAMTSAAAAVPKKPAEAPPAPAAKEPAAKHAAPATSKPAEDAPDKTAGAAKTAAPSAGQEQSSTGMWAVQLGSFSSSDNAERLAADLRGEGYAAFLSQLQGSSGPLHRVRIGPQKDRDSAEKMAAKLAAAGHKGQVVPHP